MNVLEVGLDMRAPSHSYADIVRDMLGHIYRCLDNVFADAHMSQDYTTRLRRVLAAAEASEHRSVAVSVLPLLICQAAGGEVHHAYPAAAGWCALLLSAKLLDDVADGDFGSAAEHGNGLGQVVNLAAGLLAMAGVALVNLPHPLDREVLVEFQYAILRAADGQHADLCQTPNSLKSYYAMMKGKSGASFAAGAWAGARCATNNNQTLNEYAELGVQIGIFSQINNDYQSFRREGPRGDLARGIATLPVQYARSVASPRERTRLDYTIARIAHDPTAEAGVRQIICTLGGEFYMLAELERFRQRIHETIDRLAPGSDTLRYWLAAMHP